MIPVILMITMITIYYFCMTQETVRRLPFRCYTRKGSDLDQIKNKIAGEIASLTDCAKLQNLASSLFSTRRWFFLAVTLKSIASRLIFLSFSRGTSKTPAAVLTVMPKWRPPAVDFWEGARALVSGELFCQWSCWPRERLLKVVLT